MTYRHHGPFIRYMAATDGSPASRMALAYLPALLEIGRVHLVSVTGLLSDGWPLSLIGSAADVPSSFINVVCCQRWAWLPSLSNEMIDLWTAGVRNVLIVGSAPDGDVALMATARRYDAIVVSESEALRGWETLGCERAAHCLPMSRTWFSSLVTGVRAPHTPS